MAGMGRSTNNWLTVKKCGIVFPVRQSATDPREGPSLSETKH